MLSEHHFDLREYKILQNTVIISGVAVMIGFESQKPRGGKLASYTSLVPLASVMLPSLLNLRSLYLSLVHATAGNLPRTGRVLEVRTGKALLKHCSQCKCRI